MIAATDYMRLFADQIRPFVPRRYRVLGTDGFGRSDYRRRLRDFFEVDRHWVTLAALKTLAEEGTVPASKRRRGDQPVTASTRRSRTLRRFDAARVKHASGANAKMLAIRRGDAVAIRGEVPTSATSRTCRSSRSMSSRATRSTPMTRWSRSSPTRRPWTCPRPQAGTVEEVLVKIGDRVSEGAPILRLRGRRGCRRCAGHAAHLGHRAAGAGAAAAAGRTASRLSQRSPHGAPRQLPADFAGSMPAPACAAWRASSTSI